MKKLLATILLLISISPVYAQEILYESYFTGGSLHYDDEGSGYGLLIGAFEVPYAMCFDHNGGVYIGANVKHESGFGANARFRYAISSSTSELETDMIWWTDEVLRAYDSDFVWTNLSSTSGGSCSKWILPGHEYGIYVQPTFSDPAQLYVEAEPISGAYYGYLSWDGDYSSTFLENAGVTRIISVEPEHRSSIATTSTGLIKATATVGAEVYINESDFNDDLLVRQFVYKTNSDQLHDPFNNSSPLDTPLDSNIYEYEIEDFYSSTFSTTTSFREIGKHTLRTEIIERKSFLGIDYWNKIIETKFTDFTIGTTTEIDRILEEAEQAREELYGLGGTIRTEKCDLVGFNLFDCLTGLLVMDETQTEALVNKTMDTIAVKAPIGYVTRLVSILSTDATTTLPFFGYTIKEGYPLEGDYSIDIASNLAEADEFLTETLTTDNSIIETEEGQNIWDIVMPPLEIIAYTLLILMMISKVTGLSIARHDNHVTEDEYKYKEKLYSMNSPTYGGRDSRNKEWYES